MNLSHAQSHWYDWLLHILCNTFNTTLKVTFSPRLASCWVHFVSLNSSVISWRWNIDQWSFSWSTVSLTITAGYKPNYTCHTCRPVTNCPSPACGVLCKMGWGPYFSFPSLPMSLPLLPSSSSPRSPLCCCWSECIIHSSCGSGRKAQSKQKGLGVGEWPVREETDFILKAYILLWLEFQCSLDSHSSKDMSMSLSLFMSRQCSCHVICSLDTYCMAPRVFIARQVSGIPPADSCTASNRWTWSCCWYC